MSKCGENPGLSAALNVFQNCHRSASAVPRGLLSSSEEELQPAMVSIKQKGRIVWSEPPAHRQARSHAILNGTPQHRGGTSIYPSQRSHGYEHRAELQITQRFGASRDLPSLSTHLEGGHPIVKVNNKNTPACSPALRISVAWNHVRSITRGCHQPRAVCATPSQAS